MSQSKQKNDFFLPPYVVNDFHPVLPMNQTIDWGHLELDIPHLWDLGLTGKNIKVAVCDTGVDVTHPDLAGSVYKSINTTSERFSATHGHGTGVAGIIAAQNNQSGIVGVAPSAKIYAVKCMRENGGGSMAEIIAGIQAAIDEGVHVINLSLGTSSEVASFKKVIEKAVNAGIYVVASAGNSGRDDSVVYPAKWEECFAIAATNKYGNVSSFSSRGWEVDVAAPGEKVLTTWKNKSYVRVSGTSFSAPYVSGVFALLIEAGAKLTHNLLQQTAQDIEEPGEDTKSGYGMIDPVKIYGKIPPQTPVTPPTPIPPVSDPIDLDEVVTAYEILQRFLQKNNKI